MSMYNMIMGVNPMAPVVLTILRLDPGQVPRLRDAWWDGQHLVVLTRTGGANRAGYEFENGELCKVPGYVRNKDATDFDSTYALFYYTVPDHMQWVVPQLIVETKTVGERFREKMASLGDPTKRNDPDVRRMLEAARPLVDALNDFFNKGQPR